jgi:hypothetical protein
MPRAALALLTTVRGGFYARVLLARLGAEGIIAEARGEIGGPYPLDSPVELWVESDQLEDAAELLAQEGEELAQAGLEDFLAHQQLDFALAEGLMDPARQSPPEEAPSKTPRKPFRSALFRWTVAGATLVAVGLATWEAVAHPGG